MEQKRNNIFSIISLVCNLPFLFVVLLIALDQVLVFDFYDEFLDTVTSFCVNDIVLLVWAFLIIAGLVFAVKGLKSSETKWFKTLVFIIALLALAAAFFMVILFSFFYLAAIAVKDQALPGIIDFLNEIKDMG